MWSHKLTGLYPGNKEKARLNSKAEAGQEMGNTRLFLIGSARGRHELVPEGQMIASFSMLDAAESCGNGMASRAVPGRFAQIRTGFQMDPH